MLKFVEIEDTDLTKALEHFDIYYKARVEFFLEERGNPREMEREWIFVNLIKIATEDDLGSYDWLINIITLFDKHTDSSSSYDNGLFEYALHKLSIKVGIPKGDIEDMYYSQLKREP